MRRIRHMLSLHATHIGILIHQNMVILATWAIDAVGNKDRRTLPVAKASAMGGATGFTRKMLAVSHIPDSPHFCGS